MFSHLTLALIISSSGFSTALAGLVQKPDLVLPPSAAVNRAAAEKLFTTSYDAYKYANAPHGRNGALISCLGSSHLATMI